MLESILMDQKQILPCTTYLEGEYGLTGLFIGVPTRLGASGVEEVIEFHLTDEELTALHQSADAVRELVDTMQNRVSE